MASRNTLRVQHQALVSAAKVQRCCELVLCLGSLVVGGTGMDLGGGSTTLSMFPH